MNERSETGVWLCEQDVVELIDLDGAITALEEGCPERHGGKPATW